MNILLSMPNDRQSNNYIINALQDLGHQVFFCDHRRFLKECVEGVPDMLYHAKIDMMIVLYLVPNETYSAEYICNLKTRFPQITYVSWIFDTTIGGKYCDENEDFINIIKEYDYFFTVVPEHATSLRNKGVSAFFIPEGFDPYTLDLTQMIEPIYDVSFIGQVGHPGVHQSRLPLLKKIISKHDKTIVYGPIYCDDRDVILHSARRSTFNDVEHSRIVAQSKINIGHSGWPHLYGYFSARNYRIMGSGGFLLANHSKGIEDFFELDKEIVVYDTFQDCLEKIDYYLNHEDERKAIAMAGKKKVFNNHLFSHSIQKIFDTIEGK